MTNLSVNIKCVKVNICIFWTIHKRQKVKLNLGRKTGVFAEERYSLRMCLTKGTYGENYYSVNNNILEVKGKKNLCVPMLPKCKKSITSFE